VNAVLNFFNDQLILLTDLFSENWFLDEKNYNHPAYLRWSLLNTIIQQKGIIKYPQQFSEIPLIAQIMLDSAIISTVSGGDILKFELGSFEKYGEKKVLKKIKTRLNDPREFMDIMTELNIGSWHLLENHKVTPFEFANYPDFQVESAEFPLPVIIECKNLWTLNKNRINSVTKKANNQIKNINIENFGVMVLDTSNLVPLKRVYDSEFPDEIKQIINWVSRALSEKNTSIGVCLVTWNDLMQWGEPIDPTVYMFRKRVEAIYHKNPKQALSEKGRLYQGYTTGHGIKWGTKKTICARATYQMYTKG
jgi:hypothetical protein